MNSTNFHPPKLFGSYDCDALTFWPNAEALITETPKGFIQDGDIKQPFWAIATDPLDVRGCQMALVKFLDGSPVAVRYRIHQFIIANMCPKCYRDLDFILRVLGQEGLIMHNRAHEQENYVKALRLIRDSSNERHTRDALNALIKEMT